MAGKNAPSYNIKGYQKKSKLLPILVWVIAAIIFGVGILLLVMWFNDNGGGGSFTLFASKTPTPTETFTPTPTVPTSTPTMTPTATDTPEPTNTPTPEGPIMYTVEDYDTCWGIITQFGVPLDLFLAINNLDSSCNLNPGQQVIIPGADQEMPTETPFPLEEYASGYEIEYEVQLNDYYGGIASKFNTTIESIAKLNNIDDPTSFPIMGTKLRIKVNLVTPTPTPVPTYTEMPSSE